MFTAAISIEEAERIVEDVTADLELRRVVYPKRVAERRLRQQEADYLTGLLGEILEDLAVAFQPLATAPVSFALLDRRFTWRAKVTWIDGELERCRREFPERVAKARMTRADADRRLATLDALRHLYYLRMFGWEPESPGGRRYLAGLRALNLADPADRAKLEALRVSDDAAAYHAEAAAQVKAIDLELYGQSSLAA